MADAVPFVEPETGEALLLSEAGLRTSDGRLFARDLGIPRFVPNEGYAASFGLEWNLHRETQLDSRSGTTISQDRLTQALGHPLVDLAGKTVLEPGCGAGRFTEHLLAAGANVYAFDLSTSVDAAKANLGDHPNLVLAQADIMKPPFPRDSFDLVVCLGVLQYTPSPVDTLASLWGLVKPGGRLVVDQYRREIRRWLKADTLIRLVMTRLEPHRARAVSERMVKTLFPLHWAVRGSISGRALLTRVSPVYVYASAYPSLSKAQHYEWSMLDTFNHLTGQFERTTTVPEMRRRLEALGGHEIEVLRGGNGVVARATKPSP